MRKLRLAIVSVAVFLPFGTAAADTLDRVVTWPAPPAVLKSGTDVRVEFRYRINDARGARVFVLPLRGGQPAAGYAVSGSPLYRNSGRGTATVTLRGKGGDVDAIRLQVRSVDNRLRAEKVIPAAFRFARNPLGSNGPGPGMVQVQPAPGALQPLAHPPGQMQAQPGVNVRPMVSADALRSVLGRDVLFQPTARLDDYFNSQGGGGQTVLYQTLMSPPEPREDTGADPEWIVRLDRWLDLMSTMMLFDIERIIGNQDAFARYRADEEAETDTLYEVLQYRRHTIGRLLDEL